MTKAPVPPGLRRKEVLHLILPVDVLATHIRQPSEGMAWTILGHVKQEY